MNLLPSDELAPAKRIEAEVFSGTFPSWIADDSNGGSTTARDASHAGGYWELDPGTGNRGDEATLQTSFDVHPGAYDVVEVATRVSVTTTDGDELAFVAGLEANDGDGLLYSYLNERTELDDRLCVRSDGDTTGYDARTIDDERQHEIGVRWYTTANRVELYTDRVLGATVDDIGLNPSRTYRPTWRATNRGRNHAVMRIHAAAIRYYDHPNA